MHPYRSQDDVSVVAAVAARSLTAGRGSTLDVIAAGGLLLLLLTLLHALGNFLRVDVDIYRTMNETSNKGNSTIFCDLFTDKQKNDFFVAFKNQHTMQQIFASQFS
jgi:hypothetical protein